MASVKTSNFSSAEISHLTQEINEHKAAVEAEEENHRLRKENVKIDKFNHCLHKLRTHLDDLGIPNPFPYCVLYNYVYNRYEDEGYEEAMRVCEGFQGGR